VQEAAVGIAPTSVHDAKCIILDEATNGLDAEGIADIRNLVLSFKQRIAKDSGGFFTLAYEITRSKYKIDSCVTCFIISGVTASAQNTNALTKRVKANR
jgi:ABC-type Mn2+/Zn2+ transport system ATPase subunit